VEKFIILMGGFMPLRDLVGEYALVAKVNVSDIEKSTNWYVQNLGLELDGRYSTSTWSQLNLGMPGVAIGLNLDPTHIGTGGAVTTFVVENIAQTRAKLISEGIDVGPIMNVGEGVQLAFFFDPDRNSLGLRQNSSEHPPVSQLGTNPQ
jgi:lactoylglutathione lyase